MKRIGVIVAIETCKCFLLLSPELHAIRCLF